MRYIVENSLLNFSGWCGAKEKIEYLWKNAPSCYEYIESLLEEISESDEANGVCRFTETKINDFIRFEMDEVLEHAEMYNPYTDTYFDEEGFTVYTEEEE